MKLQTATRLGLYATLELARDPDRTLSAAELAERFDVSTHHLAKVLRTLANAGLVRGGRGAAGGYRFTGNRRLDEIAEATLRSISLETLLKSPHILPDREPPARSSHDHERAGGSRSGRE
ncbi:MAG: Rrf2 family transcriptional regulator [Alphaproteobacteria bacterium]|nr:Rrf2 family transcriptional regulator [Alphaproteobacteria bacterium]